MNNEKQTYVISVPWDYEEMEDGSKIVWPLDIELSLGNFKRLSEVIENFSEAWNEDCEEALNLDYVVSVRPCSKEMPLDEKTTSLPKFVNEPWPKNREYENEQTTPNS